MNAKKTAVLLVVMALGGPALYADQVRSTVVVPNDVRMNLVCTEDMAARRQALLQFLAARSFTALDLTGNSELGKKFPANDEVIGVDPHQRIVQLSQSMPGNGQHYLTLAAAPAEYADDPELRTAIEELVQKKFDCRIEKVVHREGAAAPISAETAAWMRRTARSIREGAASNSATH